MKVLYEPKKEPMRVVAMFSGGASGAYDLLSNPDSRYNIVGGICKNADAKGIAKLGLQFPIPIVVYDIHAHHKAKNQKIKGNMEERARYDSFLEGFLLQMQPDVLIGSGDMYLTTWSDFYSILNVHPADLNRVDEAGNRIFTGDNAVLDAILYGEKETRSTVHLMTSQCDGGPIVTRSAPLRVEPRIVDIASRLKGKDGVSQTANVLIRQKSKVDLGYLTILSASGYIKGICEKYDLETFDVENIVEILRYSENHQSEMKTKCDTPAFKKALEVIAEKGLSIEDDILHIGEDPLPRSGVTIPEHSV